MKMIQSGLYGSPIQRDGFAYTFCFVFSETSGKYTVSAQRELVDVNTAVLQNAKKENVSKRTLNRILNAQDRVERLADMFSTFAWENVYLRVRD